MNTTNINTSLMISYEYEKNYEVKAILNELSQHFKIMASKYSEFI